MWRNRSDQGRAEGRRELAAALPRDLLMKALYSGMSRLRRMYCIPYVSDFTHDQYAEFIDMLGPPVGGGRQ